MNDLSEMLHAAWRAMKDGAGPERSAFSTIYVASVALDGAPKLRTVVIRRIDEARRMIGFNTDLRSPKFMEIKAEPRVAILGYDREAALQVRIEGVAVLLTEPDEKRTAWESSKARSRICYRHAYAPGTTLDHPAIGDPTDDMRKPANPDAGFDNFVAVDVEALKIDVLHLASSGHRRAVFEPHEDAWRGRWAAP